METLEENLENQKISTHEIDKLERKIYESRKRERLVNISRYITNTTKFLTEKISNYLTNFYPTSQKIFSSIILGPTTSLIVKEFLNKYDIKPQTSYLISLGIITTILSYSLQSLYQKPENQ